MEAGVEAGTRAWRPLSLNCSRIIGVPFCQFQSTELQGNLTVMSDGCEVTAVLLGLSVSGCVSSRAWSLCPAITIDSSPTASPHQSHHHCEHGCRSLRAYKLRCSMQLVHGMTITSVYCHDIVNSISFQHNSTCPCGSVVSYRLFCHVHRLKLSCLTRLNCPNLACPIARHPTPRDECVESRS